MADYSIIKIVDDDYDSKSRTSTQKANALDKDGNFVIIKRTKFHDSWYHDDSGWSNWELSNG